MAWATVCVRQQCQGRDDLVEMSLQLFKASSNHKDGFLTPSLPRVTADGIGSSENLKPTYRTTCVVAGTERRVASDAPEVERARALAGQPLRHVSTHPALTFSARVLCA